MALRVAIAAIERSITEGAKQIPLTFFGGEPLRRKGALLGPLAVDRPLGRRHESLVTAKVYTKGLLANDAFIAAAQLELFNISQLRCRSVAEQRSPHRGWGQVTVITISCSRPVPASNRVSRPPQQAVATVYFSPGSQIVAAI